MPRSVLGFRVLTFVVGLTYVFATTDTIKPFQIAFDGLRKLGAVIEPLVSASEKPPTESAGKPK